MARGELGPVHGEGGRCRRDRRGHFFGCVYAGAGTREPQGKKMIYISVRSKYPSLSALPDKGQFRKGCLSTIGKR